nr:MAG TPA: hypothetical protein [Caudoviricetes sp.]
MKCTFWIISISTVKITNLYNCTMSIWHFISFKCK